MVHVPDTIWHMQAYLSLNLIKCELYPGRRELRSKFTSLRACKQTKYNVIKARMLASSLSRCVISSSKAPVPRVQISFQCLWYPTVKFNNGASAVVLLIPRILC